MNNSTRIFVIFLLLLSAQGVALAAEIDSMHFTTPGYRVAETSPKVSAGFIGDLRKNAQTDGGSASNQIRQRQAILSLDLPGELGLSLEQTAKRVRAKMLVMGSPEDHTVNPKPALRFARAIGAPVVKLDSLCGHSSFSCISIGTVVAQFLENPASLRSQTLRDSAKP